MQNYSCQTRAHSLPSGTGACLRLTFPFAVLRPCLLTQKKASVQEREGGGGRAEAEDDNIGFSCEGIGPEGKEKLFHS